MYIYTVYPSHSYFFLSPAWSHKTARGDVTGQAVEIDAPDWIMFDMVRNRGVVDHRGAMVMVPDG